MSQLPSLSGEFRVVEDPELRFTPSGKAVCSLRLVANSRKKDDSTGEWKDDKVFWLRGSVWDRAAENVAESVQKGDLVIVTGRPYTNEYETREGEKRQSTEIMIDSIGPALRWTDAKITRTQRQQGGQQAAQQQGPGTNPPPGGPAAVTTPPQDPWQTPQQGDEPPF